MSGFATVTHLSAATGEIVCVNFCARCADNGCASDLQAIMIKLAKSGSWMCPFFVDRCGELVPHVVRVKP